MRIPNSTAGVDFAHSCGEVAGAVDRLAAHPTQADANLKQIDEPAQW